MVAEAGWDADIHGVLCWRNHSRSVQGWTDWGHDQTLHSLHLQSCQHSTRAWHCSSWHQRYVILLACPTSIATVCHCMYLFVIGANIFLTEDGLKLGDFGSSVKLKESTTMKTCLAGRTIGKCPHKWSTDASLFKSRHWQPLQAKKMIWPLFDTAIYLTFH